MRWGMVIDLARCVGCQTCTIACGQGHGLPPGHQWRFVADCEVGDYPDVSRVFLPMQCMHCADPPCVPVCPTGASRQREDGIVWVDYDACLGCGYCAVACPYRARHLIHAAGGYFDVATPPEVIGVEPGRVGVMTKCTFCKERVDAGRARGLMPGVDPEATPICAVACISGAITFGDLDDPLSRVSRLAATGAATPLMPELGTGPSVYYLPPLAEPGPGPATAAPARVPDVSDRRADAHWQTCGMCRREGGAAAPEAALCRVGASLRALGESRRIIHGTAEE